MITDIEHMYETESDCLYAISRGKFGIVDPEAHPEQCPICKKWTLSAADSENGRMVGIGDAYQDKFDGNCRVCEPCEAN